MRRRDLLGLGVGAAAGLALPGCEGRSRRVDDSPVVEEPKRVEIPHPELEELDLEQLRGRLRSGAETARSLVAKYTARIAAVDAVGAKLHAVLALDPRLEAIAHERDMDVRNGFPPGALHGVPVLVKDNIDTEGPLPTTAGSLALADTFARGDAPLVDRLRRAGAIILGKSNLSEWANLRGNQSSSGWSALGGQCRNPFALDRSPSGSSSGSAAAVSANLCALAVGTETDGSLVSPGSCCGIVAVKPTVGLISQAGIIPISFSQDTAGPMARTVRDAAALLEVLVDTPVDYTTGLHRDALRGARIGIPRAGYFGAWRSVDKVVEGAIAQLSALGAVIVDNVELPIPPELGPAELEVMLTELKVGMERYLATRIGSGPRTLADLIAFNTAHAERELRLFGQEQFEAAQSRTDLTAQAYVDARALCIRLARTEGLDKAMDAHQLDAIFHGTNSAAWLIDPVNGDGTGWSPSSLPAIAGYPHVTVPAGYHMGLPIGVSFVGRARTEAQLLGYAFAFEQATRQRTAPKLAPTANVDAAFG